MKQIFTYVMLLTASYLSAQKTRLVIPIGHAASVDAVAFSPDGKQVLTGSDDYTAKLWDRSGREIQSFKGHSYPIKSVAFSPDGKYDPSESWIITPKFGDFSGNEFKTSKLITFSSPFPFSLTGKKF